MGRNPWNPVPGDSRLRPQSGVVTSADAAREVGASVSLARGFLPHKAAREGVRPVLVGAQRRPFESQCPTAVGKAEYRGRCARLAGFGRRADR